MVEYSSLVDYLLNVHKALGSNPTSIYSEQFFIVWSLSLGLSMSSPYLRRPPSCKKNSPSPYTLSKVAHLGEIGT